MRFLISSDRLKEALSRVGAVVPSKTTLPILQDILFELKGNTLYLTATDLEISVRMAINPVDGEEDGAIAIPEDKLTSVIKALPEGLLLKFESLDSDRILITTNKGGEYKMSAEPSDSFPAIPESIDSTAGFGVTISGEVLKEIIENTVFATSKEELRPATMGVLFQFRENEFIAVATDGYRLVKMSRKGVANLKGKSDSSGVIVPAKTLQIIAKSIEDEDICEISINEKHIQFSTENITIISRLIDEKYPNYESVIPYENNKELIVERDLFLSTVKRVSIFANTTTNQIKFTLDPKGYVEVSAEDIDFGGSAKEVLNCTYNGDPMEIGFNAKFITDILGHLDSDKVIFKFGSPTRAAIVQPYETMEDREILMLVMPMRLNA
ncbi:MAG: DNA polymerase III subunit beta [Candidatus Kryptonium sp.]|nr:DNA polymerase III subunit beta [Candidatus Kryptonium sp.]MCX7761237.1 DNA polymerase III subunit beta [Candidatus Kryptonium sp.]MDW8108528.1 DNA polymerase III subunit beta [Candidatus Kryptonium sp.]